ncbi:MAG: branched-chain amino acid transport system II carrier protein [Oligoflexales bacterium]
MNEDSGDGKVNIASIGMAMFSMFFGSGNIVFPVLIGQYAQSMSLFAIFGLLITAVLVPFCGLFALSLYDGDYIKFFSRLGVIPGWVVVSMIMALIGPFAVIPRCIVISYGAVDSLVPGLDLVTFSGLSVIIVFLCTINRSKILDILGLVLTPILLLSLVTIIIKGLFFPGGIPDQSSLSGSEAFFHGLIEGYNTMDLFAAFMFSSVVLSGIKKIRPNIEKQPKELLGVYLKASSIGMGLLAAIYIGMCFVAAIHGSGLKLSSPDKALGELVLQILGSYAGLVVCAAVSLACLTTAISLTVVFSEFMAKHVSRDRISYRWMLVGTLIISFVVSTLRFEGIQGIVVPILKLSLPSLMVFTGLNLANRFYGFKPVKSIVLGTLLTTALYQLYF